MSRFSAIVADLTEQLGGIVSVKRNRTEVVRHAAPPHVVVVRAGGTIDPTQEIGRRDVRSNATRSLHQRTQQCEVYCWGRDYDEAEDLLHNVIVALHHGAQGSYVIGAYRDRNEEEDRFSDLLLGELIILSVGVQIPVNDELRKLKQVSVFDHVGNWQPASHPMYGFAHLNHGMPAVTYGPIEEGVC